MGEPPSEDRHEAIHLGDHAEAMGFLEQCRQLRKAAAAATAGRHRMSLDEFINWDVHTEAEKAHLRDRAGR